MRQLQLSETSHTLYPTELQALDRATHYHDYNGAMRTTNCTSTWLRVLDRFKQCFNCNRQRRATHCTRQSCRHGTALHIIMNTIAQEKLHMSTWEAKTTKRGRSILNGMSGGRLPVPRLRPHPHQGHLRSILAAAATCGREMILYIHAMEFCKAQRFSLYRNAMD